MKLLVLAKMVPDLVEELEVDSSGTALDTDWLRLIISESDDHAIEQAILIKEGSGGSVAVVTPDAEDADDVLYTASAKGADELIKLVGEFDPPVNNHGLARVVAQLVKEHAPDMVLTGVQAHNDLDGPVGPILAEYCGMPYVGYVAGVSVGEGSATVRKEYPGGLQAEMTVSLPAVLGIQVAEQPPRYVAVSKVRQSMKTAEIDERDIDEVDTAGGPTVSRMYVPESGERAEMIDGDEEEVAAKLVELFREAGAL
jgi:electron transfer flavoprotein beta subunit